MKGNPEVWQQIPPLPVSTRKRPWIASLSNLVGTHSNRPYLFMRHQTPKVSVLHNFLLYVNLVTIVVKEITYPLILTSLLAELKTLRHQIISESAQG